MKIKDIEKYKPVKIKIDDPRSYLKVAILVDSPMFLFDIDQIRQDFEITTFFKYGDYATWNHYLSMLADFDDSKDVGTQKIQKDKLDELKSEFEEKIAITRQTFNYPARFDDLIKQAIIFNEVRDTLIPAYPSVFSSQDKYGWNRKYSEINAIVFEPFATEKDIIAAFEEWKQLPKDGKARELYERELYSDTSSNAERDRKWFWQKYKEGMSYPMILESWNQLCPFQQQHDPKGCKYCELDQNVIEQAVSAYRKRIQLLFASKP